MVFEQKENEEIKITLRRHWSCMIGLSVFAVVMSILPIIMYFILDSYIHLTNGFYNLFVLGMGLYYMFVCTLAFIGWLDYYLDVAVITNERVVDIDQEGFFNRKISELYLSDVEDVTGTIKGALGTFLDFGDVTVQSAGNQAEFILDKVPHPYKITKLIIDLHQDCLQGEIIKK